MPGYKPAKVTFTLVPGAAKPFPVTLKLEPEAIRVRLSSGLKSGQVSLDGQPPVELQDGNFANDAISVSNEHTFALTQSGRESLTFSFRADPGGIATLTAPLKAREVTAVLITNLASGAHLYASDRSLKGGLKDATPRPIPDDGLELGGITANAEVLIDDGKSQRSYSLEVGNAPTITIWLANDPNQGAVEVDVRTPGAERSIDGRKARPLRVRGSTPSAWTRVTHTIRISKDGYEPIERTVELKKGETVKWGVIDLKPVVLTSSLVIEGATRDAEVLIDGNAKGNVSGDGFFRLNDLSPGDHAITLRKADFEDKQFPRSFAAGQTIRIAGTEGQLTSSFGSFVFRVSPPNANITYRRLDETLAHAAENGKDGACESRAAMCHGHRQRQGTSKQEHGCGRARNHTARLTGPYRPP